MSVPLPLLQAEKSNIYELTCAAIRRASQLSRMEEMEQVEEKVVPRAVEQILTRTVQYRIEE